MFVWTLSLSMNTKCILYRQFHVYRDDLFVRLPEGGESPKQKVNLPSPAQNCCSSEIFLIVTCHNVTSTWFKPIQGTEVLMRQIPRLCHYFRVRAASKSLNNQPDAGEEKRSVRPLQKHKSQGLFHVHTWIFPWSYYTKVREILVFTNVYWKKRSHGSQVDVVSPFLHSPLDCHVIYMFVIFWKSHTVYQIPLHRPTHILPECLLEDQCRCIINSICISPMTCYKC